jgi:hypothetical protein
LHFSFKKILDWNLSLFDGGHFATVQIYARARIGKNRRHTRLISGHHPGKKSLGSPEPAQ